MDDINTEGETGAPTVLKAELQSFNHDIKNRNVSAYIVKGGDNGGYVQVTINSASGGDPIELVKDFLRGACEAFDA